MCICVTGASASPRRGTPNARHGRGRAAAALMGWALALGLAPPVAAGTGGAVVVYGWPNWAGAGLVYPWYFAPGPCLAYAPCAAWAWEDRRPWRRPVAPEPQVFDEQNLWATSGSPWGYLRRLPPPTPESQIQPAYRDASTIRPEYLAR